MFAAFTFVTLHMDFLITVLRFIWFLFLALMVFNLMIVVHEWGHFLAGRWRGLKIDRFQIWFGKPLWKKTINGVQYGLGSIPAGGFVSLPQMAPMESIEGEVDDEELKNLPPITPLDKIIVAVAGPLFSFLLAVAFAVVVWGVGTPVHEAVSSTMIGGMPEIKNAEGKMVTSPAKEAGLQIGDTIKEVDGMKIERFMGMTDSVMWAVLSSDQEVLNVKIDRPGKGEMSVDVDVPRPQLKKTEGNFIKKAWGWLANRPPLRAMGVSPAITPVVGETMEFGPAAESGLEKGDVITSINGRDISYFHEYQAFPWKAGETYKLGIKRGKKEMAVDLTPQIPDVRPKDFDRTLTGIIPSRGGVQTIDHPNPIAQVTKAGRSIGGMLKALFTPKSGVSAGHMNGPVAITGVYYDLFQTPDGWKKVLWFSVLLNVNLAILNMLPFPVLDGGHIVMASYEWIRKKTIPLKILEVVQTAFVLFLFGFMLFVTFKDVGDRVPKGTNPNAEENVMPRFLSPAEKAEAAKKND